MESKLPLLAPNYIVADGKLIDLDSLKPERTIFIRENETPTDRQSPWYTAHYQELTKGLTSIDYTGWSNSVVAIFGEKAFPIATNGAGDVIISGAEFGKVLTFLQFLFILACFQFKCSKVLLSLKRILIFFPFHNIF